MSTALTRENARIPGGLRWCIRPLIVFAAGIALAVALYAVEESMPDSAFCTPPDPDCGPNWAGAALFGVHVGLLGIAFLHLAAATVAAWVLAAMAIVLQVADPWFPSWVPALFVVYAVVVTLANVHAGVESRRIVGALPSTSVVEPSVVGRLSPIGLRWFVLATLLVGVGVTVLVWSVQLQRQETAREARADLVVGTIERVHGDRYSLAVRFREDGGIVEVQVDFPEDYRAGDEADFYVSGDWIRSAYEPYDVTHVGAFAALLFTVAGAAATRGAAPNVGRRRLLRRPQPRWSVRARPGYTEIAVYPLDARDGDAPLLTIPLLPALDPADPRHRWFPSSDDNTTVDGAGDDDNGDDTATGSAGNDGIWIAEVPAALVGAPLPGSWATVMIDDRLLIPAKPAGSGETGLPAGDLTELAAHDLVPVPEETGVLHPRDARAHPLSPAAEWRPARATYATVTVCLAALIGGYAAAGSPELGGYAPLAAAVLGLALVEILWRTDLAPRADWDGTGVTVTRAGPQQRFDWEDIAAIDLYGDDLVVVAGRDDRDSHLHLPPRPIATRLGLHQGRSAPQLYSALRRTRTAALAAGPNERARHPAARPGPATRPWPMYALALLAAAVVALLT